jgi:hypothetical protein
MPSIGYTNPIAGSGGMTPNPGIHASPLGGGLPGFIPQAVNDTNNYDEYAVTRFTLRQAWNTKYPSQLKVNDAKRIVTPFRAVNNAGDILCRENYSCGGPCQTFQSRPGLKGLRTHFGHISDSCSPNPLWSPLQVNLNVPPSSCNGKFVYDSSDYITYLKQKAVNKNYNDLSNAGNKYSGAQSAWRAVRRY